MRKQKPIPARIRFEVLKRDHFRCQYCGRAAPEIVLHVDHVVPLKNGGKTDVLNLVSACVDCNLGKAAVPLSDSSAVEKQRAAVELAATRKEQVEMMAQWARELTESKDAEVAAVVEALNRRLAVIQKCVSLEGVATVRKWVRRFPLSDLLGAIDDAGANHPVTENDDGGAFWTLVPKYAQWRPALREKPYLHRLFYASAILRRRFGDRVAGRHENLVDVLDSFVAAGLTPEEVVTTAKAASTKNGFFDVLNRLADEKKKD